ncbi:MAG: SusC/RagA family TonB-linked outer membrane protein [Chitinophagaceae bacterium]
MRNFQLPRAGVLLCAVLLFSSLALAQERTITGTVTDATGSPLAGATISVKGQSAGNTVTQMNGSFSIKVPASAKTLTISYVGMIPQDLSIQNGSQFSVTLQAAENSLNEVVLIGYGQSKRSNLTSAQTTVSAKDLERTINTTLEQAIQGRAAGVYVTQNSGQPGGGMSVNIRGISSLGRTQPLYVVDGVQIQGNEDVAFGNQSSSNTLAGINTADIADVQILQGPSATAIYGSRASNGVVLITTKRGRSGDVKINYAYQHSLQMPPESLDVMNLSEYAQMVKEYHALAGGTTPQEFLDPSLLGKGTDWQRELFNVANMAKHQLSLSGGTGGTTFYASAEHLNQEGVALGSGFKRYGFRLNLDNNPRDWIKIGFNLNYNQTNEVLTTTNYGNAESPLIANALRLTPQIPVTNLDGSWGGSDPVNGANQFAPVNPVALANLITNDNMRRQFLGGINLRLNLVKGLTFQTSFNGNVGNGLSTYYTPTYEIDQWHYNLIASLTTGTYSSWYWNWNQMLEYSIDINKHNISAMVSHEAQESEWKALAASRTGFLTNDVFDVNAGDPVSATNSGGTYPWSIESYFGRLKYSYDNRYLLEATLRRDGTPYFGPSNRWGVFPALSAAWRVTQEKFWNIDFISELKLRFETGLTGNQGTGAGIYSRLSTDATPWGTGFLVSELKNLELGWEETKTNNFGLNVGLLNNRFNIEADYYIKNTDNLILNANVPWYMGTGGSPGGVNPPLVNTGALRTKGWNLTLGGTIINKRDFRWESNLNLSHFDTRVEALTGDRPFIQRTSWWMNNWTQRSTVGMQPWLFRGYIEEGLFQSVDEIANSALPLDNNGNPRPIDPNNGIWVGDVKYRDINGDGKIDVNDETNIGNPWPKYTAGFTNNLSFKGFELSTLFTASFGNDIYNYIAAQNSNPNNVNLSRNFFVDATNYAKLEEHNGNVRIVNSDTRIPRITNNQVANDNNYGKITNRFVEDGTYIRLKNVSLSYNFPSSLLSRLKVIKSLRATVGAQNVFTITKYKGYDPEVGAYIGTGSSTANQAIGIDFGRYPLTRMYTATISVNF